MKRYTEAPADFFDSPANTDDSGLVAPILERVRAEGDAAVLDFSRQFGETLESLEISNSDIDVAYQQIPESIQKTLSQAHKRIQDFAKRQLDCISGLSYEDTAGLHLGHRLIPMERVGCYVPGGRYPLPSSALMTATTANVAGVSEIVLCSPKITPITIVAAHMAGATRIFRIGGAQAVAAMAYGTQTIPKVDKIVGPGNRYVTAAKRAVFGEVGIDFLAGPSELMVIADETATPGWIARDLLAQAEHDPDARVSLVLVGPTSHKWADAVETEVNHLLKTLPTANVAKQSIEKSTCLLLNSLDEAVEIANRKAPEHLSLQFRNAWEQSERFTHCGSLFVGPYAAEVFGDYCSGPNHVLPTGGVARFTGGLTVFDFLKIVNVQYAPTEKAIQPLIPLASSLAELEGLYGHQASATIRELKKL